METFSITSTVLRVPRSVRGLPFETAKTAVLGKKYDLSLAFIGQNRSRALNRTYRGKDYSTNVLSFQLSPDSGEIFIDLAQAKKEYKKFGMSFEDFVFYLFIHGILHLSGLEHGSTMESKENKLLSKFQINGPSTKSRD